jgi:hypothetical protein
VEGIVKDNEEDGRITLTNVNDSQYQQQIEALRLVRRIRAKQYLLLKLGNTSTTGEALYTPRSRAGHPEVRLLLL